MDIFGLKIGNCPYIRPVAGIINRKQNTEHTIQNGGKQVKSVKLKVKNKNIPNLALKQA
jgi:hypothetical protein